MYGSWLLNLMSSLVIFIFYLTLSVLHNTLLRASIEASMAAIVFFFIVYFFRWAIHYFNTDTNPLLEEDVPSEISNLTEEDIINYLNQDQQNEELTDHDLEKTTEYIRDLINE